MATDAEVLGEKMVSARERLSWLPRSVALVRQAAPGQAAVWAVLLVVQGLVPLATLVLTREVVDGLTAALAAGRGFDAAGPLPWLVAATATVLVLGHLVAAGAGWLKTTLTERVRDHVMVLVQQRSLELDLSVFEHAAHFDRLQRAQSLAKHRPLGQVEALGALLQSGVTLTALAAALVPYGAWLPAALLLSTVPALWLLLRERLDLYNWARRTTEDERRLWHQDWTMTGREGAAELRIFDLGPAMRRAYDALRGRLRDERLALARRRAVVEVVIGLGGLVVAALAFGYQVWRTARGLLSLGALALIYQAFTRGQTVVRSMASQISDLYGTSLFLGDLFEFLDGETGREEPAEPSPPPAPLRQGLSFDDVSYRYPGAERPALAGLTVHVPAGAFVAVVGPNGAGKSTMVKLACRLLDPTGGTVAWDGVDLRRCRHDELWRQVTVLFQEPFRYRASVHENIAPDGTGTRAAVEAAARAAGAHEFIEGLPEGYDTALGKWFSESTDVSVGQWQRIALARAFFRPAPLILLDEPTAAMDAWAERDWLARFRELTAGRTAVVVTHRFTTAMHADCIIVVQDGRVVEQGTHGELQARGGIYATSLEPLGDGTAGDGPPFSDPRGSGV